MTQGRPHSGARRTPHSGKQRKAQLQAQRAQARSSSALDTPAEEAVAEDARGVQEEFHTDERGYRWRRAAEGRRALADEAARLGEAIRASFGAHAALARRTDVPATPCADLAEARAAPPASAPAPAPLAGAFDAVVLREDLSHGQAVLKYSPEVEAANGTWLGVVRPKAPHSSAAWRWRSADHRRPHDR